MSLPDRPASATAIGLRHAFDRSFAEPSRDGRTTTDDFLMVRIGSDSYAIRLSDVAGLFLDKAITRLPTRYPALVGTAGFRGSILPVYELAVLLGCPPTTALSRWMVLAAKTPVALTLNGFDGHLRIARQASAPRASGSEPLRPHLREVVRTPDGVRPILNLQSVVNAIKHQLPQDALLKE